ncbi:MAG: GAF domain-containing protein, partial [Actinomycetota bacterium]|nr:GAF domain-containing protein [Actinomycetota bacterium]
AINTNLILPAFKIFQFNGLGPLFSLFMVGFMSYAIVKHRLMDIRLVVARSVVYSLLVLAIGAIYISIIFFLKRGYETTLHINRDTLFIIAGFAVAFGFQPLRRFLQKYTDKIFFKEMYDPQELLGKLSKIMSSTLKLDDLLNSMLKVIVSEMRISKAAFVLTSNGDIIHVKTIGYGRIPNSSCRKVASLIKDKEIIVADELMEESKEKDILRELEIAVLVPLQAESNLIGVLVLGEKRSGDMFTIQDLKFLGVLAPEVAVAIKNAELFEEKEKRILELSALNKLAFSLGAELDIKDILNQAIDQALVVTGADSGSIMLLDEETQTLTIKAARGIEPEFEKKTRLKVGQGIAGWVAKASEPLIITDTEDGRFKELLRRDEIISALSVPLKAKEKVIGVLSVNRKTSKEPFTKENLNLISSFAAQVAVAIENARLYKDLEITFLGAISALAAAVEAKDHYTFGHSQVVTRYAIAIAKELSLPESEIESIRIASMLHDIGKIGLDGTILNKPGKLTPEERALVNLHPLIGVNILKSLEFLKGAIPLILYHHEHFDGMGYPEGIAGKTIPLGARIIAVADAFNAMVSERPYRSALSIEEAIEELRNHSGTQFDPTVVEAFLRILRRESSEPPEMYLKITTDSSPPT